MHVTQDQESTSCFIDNWCLMMVQPDFVGTDEYVSVLNGHLDRSADNARLLDVMAVPSHDAITRQSSRWHAVVHGLARQEPHHTTTACLDVTAATDGSQKILEISSL